MGTNGASIQQQQGGILRLVLSNAAVLLFYTILYSVLDCSQYGMDDYTYRDRDGCLCR